MSLPRRPQFLTRRPGPARRGRRRRRAFTLIEVLAALALIGIVLPVTMQGVNIALAAASTARHQAEAATLAETKLNEILAIGDPTVSSATSGDFGEDWKEYRWTMESTTRDYDVTEMVLHVFWVERGQQRTLSVATMIFDAAAGAANAAGAQ